MTIKTYASKGSGLTYGEMDSNLSQLAVKTNDGWRDLVCGLELRGGTNAPTYFNFRDGIWLPGYDDATMNEAFITAHIGHDYKVGTMLYPHIHWSTNSTVTGVVRWGYEYTWARRFDSTGQIAFPATNTLYVEQTADGTPYKHYVAESAEGQGIPAGTIEVDTILLIRVFRDATHINDTFADIAFGYTFDLHYECDRHATPLRAPPFYG